MGSKAIVFLGLLVAMLLLVSSEVAARNLVEETSAKAAEAEPAQYGGGGRYGGGGGRYGGGGGRYGGGGGRYGGGGCRRCCGRYGCRCCNPGEAVDADFNEVETHN